LIVINAARSQRDILRLPAHRLRPWLEVKLERRSTMSMLKVIEVLAESEKSFEDAAQNAVTQA